VKFVALDAMRGLAALVVVFWHAQGEFAPIPRPASGYLAVDFFFCLSGLVIAQAYEDRLQSGLSVAKFAFLRLIRFYPLFAIGLLILPLSAILTGQNFARHVPHPALAIGFSALMLPTPPSDPSSSTR
jgi:peptidoglycan/LPS O-acetylase OafA/YrhL